MDLRRLRAGEWIIAGGGVAALVALFLPWYEGGAGQSPSGWESFAVTDLVLAIASLTGLALFVVTAVQRAPAVAIAYDALFTLAALVATVAVGFRVLNLPGDLAERETGLWLGLAAGVAMVVGGFVAMRDERRPHGGRFNDPSGLPIESPPPIETLPAPPREAARP